ncbi:protein kinase family protein [Striga asiatica]|uniref:RING-type E3 ubiquitin transferase n=1 Tax=Striga asiatica TaxID=4170 RepID=A0A5A7P6J4_STRAF|nr:protein kinase family protein [Striga asiatica]
MSNFDQNSLQEGKIIISAAVAIDKDKNSQFAVKWAIDKLRLKDKRIILVHVRSNYSYDSVVPKEGREPTQAETQQLFLPYRSFCARKGIRATEVILQDHDVARGLAEYISINSITTIVLGASSRAAILRAFKNADVPSSVARCAPDSCTVYAVSKGKVVKLKSGSQPETPSSSTSSMPRNALFSPADNSSQSSYYAPDSWKSPNSEVSSFDIGNQSRQSPDGAKNTIPLYSGTNTISREYHQNQIPQKERSYGSKSTALQNSTNSEESERHSNTKYSTPYDSDNTSNEGSTSYYSNYSSSPVNSKPGETDFGHMANRQANNSKISNLMQSLNNMSLEVRKRGSPGYSMSESSDVSEGMSFPSDVSFEVMDHYRVSDSSRSSTSSQTAEIDDELRRLKQDLHQITMKYNLANQEAATARDKVRGLIQSKIDEGSKLDEARQAHEAALAIVEREKLMCKAAVEVAHKAQRIAELESEKRKHAELKYKQESEEKQKAIDALARSEIRYRRYTMDEIEIATDYFLAANKIGEGGYGPVFKATLDHTPVAIKVLRPDISQGEQQFQKEVEVLSRMRHPNMVVLLGACPEYGSLVYEYMENGSLEDRLHRKNGSPPLSWPARFRISAEIATALNFLHSTRPEPLVHRDLKPGNILLDRNLVSKISDVGLCRLVPPPVADTITQCHMTAAAGTFCYIDPEYQQTGMLGTKSDVYSFGVMLLQILTARPAMGLSHYVETAIENGRFGEVLDRAVGDWPVEEALSLAKLALKCCELRRRDRPDLNSVILTELERLRDLGSEVARGGGVSYCYVNLQGGGVSSKESSSSESQVNQERFYDMNSSSSQRRQFRETRRAKQKCIWKWEQLEYNTRKHGICDKTFMINSKEKVDECFWICLPMYEFVASLAAPPLAKVLSHSFSYLSHISCRLGDTSKPSILQLSDWRSLAGFASPVTSGFSARRLELIPLVPFSPDYDFGSSTSDEGSRRRAFLQNLSSHCFSWSF